MNIDNEICRYVRIYWRYCGGHLQLPGQANSTASHTRPPSKLENATHQLPAGIRQDSRCVGLLRIDDTILYLPFSLYPLPFIPMRRAIYPGSFDPVTNGHLDIIGRGCKLFDEIIIAVLINPDKTPFFSLQERCEILRAIVTD